jgi:hypothetical protein
LTAPLPRTNNVFGLPRQKTGIFRVNVIWNEAQGLQARVPIENLEKAQKSDSRLQIGGSTLPFAEYKGAKKSNGKVYTKSKLLLCLQ